MASLAQKHMFRYQNDNYSIHKSQDIKKTIFPISVGVGRGPAVKVLWGGVWGRWAMGVVDSILKIISLYIYLYIKLFYD